MGRKDKRTGSAVFEPSLRVPPVAGLEGLFQPINQNQERCAILRRLPLSPIFSIANPKKIKNEMHLPKAFSGIAAVSILRSVLSFLADRLELNPPRRGDLTLARRRISGVMEVLLTVNQSLTSLSLWRRVRVRICKAEPGLVSKRQEVTITTVFYAYCLCCSIYFTPSSKAV